MKVVAAEDVSTYIRAGKKYEVIRETDGCYYIRDDSGAVSGGWFKDRFRKTQGTCGTGDRRLLLCPSSK